MSSASQEVIIRAATEGDASAASSLIHSLTDFFLPDPEDPEAAAPFFDSVTPAAYRGYFADPRYRYLVAEHEGAVVGVVGLRDGTHLFHLYIARSFHRRGLAVRLWNEAKAATLAAGHPGRFTVNSSLYAVPVYRRFGFVATGPVQKKDGLAFQPMVLDERE